jgi:peptide-methionine (S)-S-oxide reductase
VIFYHTDEQKEVAEKVIEELKKSKAFKTPIVTQIEPFREFYEAEDYHRDYFERHPEQPYCQVVIAPKIDKLRKLFGAQLSEDFSSKDH